MSESNLKIGELDELAESFSAHVEPMRIGESGPIRTNTAGFGSIFATDPNPFSPSLAASIARHLSDDLSFTFGVVGDLCGVGHVVGLSAYKSLLFDLFSPNMYEDGGVVHLDSYRPSPGISFSHASIGLSHDVTQLSQFPLDHLAVNLPLVGSRSVFGVSGYPCVNCIEGIGHASCSARSDEDVMDQLVWAMDHASLNPKATITVIQEPRHAPQLVASVQCEMRTRSYRMTFTSLLVEHWRHGLRFSSNRDSGLRLVSNWSAAC